MILVSSRYINKPNSECLESPMSTPEITKKMLRPFSGAVTKTSNPSSEENLHFSGTRAEAGCSDQVIWGCSCDEGLPVNLAFSRWFLSTTSADPWHPASPAASVPQGSRSNLDSMIRYHSVSKKVVNFTFLPLTPPTGANSYPSNRRIYSTLTPPPRGVQYIYPSMGVYLQ